MVTLVCIGLVSACIALLGVVGKQKRGRLRADWIERYKTKTASRSKEETKHARRRKENRGGQMVGEEM